MLLYPYRTIDIVVANKDGITIRRDWFGFFCKKCFAPHIVYMNYAISNRLNTTDEETGMPTTTVYCLPHFFFTCPKCGHKNEWEGHLDPNITPMLAKLNRKGYETLFSCEGHMVTESCWHPEDNTWDTEEQAYSCPYILFKNPHLKEVCKYIPPMGNWKLDNDNVMDKDAFCISVDEQYRSKSENMAWLKRWVGCLPFLDDNNEFDPAMVDDHIKTRIEEANKPLTEDERVARYTH